MQAHRVIFRVDLDSANYDILDTPGTTLRILQQTKAGFFSQFHDAIQNRLVVASTGDVGDAEAYRLSVSPVTIDFSYETEKGIDLAKLDSADNIRTLFKCMQELTDHYKLKKLKRSGIRIYQLGSVGKGNPDLAPLFRRGLAQPFVDAIDSALGTPLDYGVHVDGEKDALKYHATFGPYKAAEAAKYFERVHTLLASDDTRNLICDVDMYEESFVQTVSWTVWTRTATARAVDFSSRLQRSIADMSELDNAK